MTALNGELVHYVILSHKNISNEESRIIKKGNSVEGWLGHFDSAWFYEAEWKGIGCRKYDKEAYLYNYL